MNPEAVLRVKLDYSPRLWQLKCHTALKRFSVLALHRRAGKSELAIMHLINSAVNFDKELGLFFYVAPYLKQAKIIAWARLKQKLAPMIQRGAVEINESELTARFLHNGAIIRIFGGDNPDAMRGVRLDGAVIDEVAQIKPEVWIDIIRPALSDRKGWALFIGTPNGINLFSELYYSAEKQSDWYRALFTVYDTEAIDPDEIENLKATMSETSFAREYLCDFTASGDDQLISLAEAHAACERVYKAEDIDYAPRILGVDPARFGDDRSAICKRQGLQVFPIETHRGLNNMELAGRVAHIIDTWHPDAVFIDAGAGSGVIDRLRQLNHDIVEVNFGGKATSSTFVNKRCEMWFTLAEAIKHGGLALPRDNALMQDLGAPTYWYDETGKRKLESKDDIKKRGLPSTDLGDALALTFAFPVAKKLIPLFPVNMNARKVSEGYDPYHNHDSGSYDPYARL